MSLRKANSAWCTANFYPDYYDSSWTRFSPDGYGIDETRQVAIFHRWSGSDLYMIVLNFSDMLQLVNVPLPQNGTWIDLLNNPIQYNSSNYSLYNFAVQSNWGCILHWKT